MSRVAPLALLLLAPTALAAETASHAGAWSLFGPTVAIVLALVTRQVVPSLAAGAVISSIVAAQFDVITGIFGAFAQLRDVVFGKVDAAFVQEHGLLAAVGAWLAHDKTQVTLFSLLVAALVGVVYRAGATRDLVRKVEVLAKGRRGAMVASWLSGTIVFFDDYANCLVVGGAMGPLYDRHRVSRAKLAYIVDSTAAPVASLALVSTWVGFEVGLIAEGLEGTGVALTGFAVFLAALPFRFYAVYTLAFVGSIAISGRDFGPMRAAEASALLATDTGTEEEDSAGSGHWWVAALGVIALIGVTFASLYLQGVAALGDGAADALLFEILGEANPYKAMLQGSMVGLGLAIALSVASRSLSPAEVGPAVWSGIRPVFEALAILYLAWTLGGAVKATGAAPYLAGLIDATLPIATLPTVAFLLSAAIAFATGTSWATMSILLPTVVQIAAAADPEMGPVALGSIAAVLAGSCLGDHSSPISDTTVLSAMGSGVDVVTHVRTQLPYALTTGLISILVGYVPAGLGLSAWWCLPVGIATAVAVVLLVGKPLALPEREVHAESF